MYLHKTILLLLLTLPLSGCHSGFIRPDALPGRVQVFDVQLYTTRDYLEINGDVATEEPCLRGYERSFDRLQLTIGYDFDRKIRKITTRNPATSIFAISPGMKFTACRQLIASAGFTPFASPHVFRNGPYLFTVQADNRDIISGLILETLE